MSETTQWKEAILLLGIAALGLSMVIGGYQEMPDDGSAIAYMFEVGLPALISVIALWRGVALWQSSGKSVESST